MNKLEAVLIVACSMFIIMSFYNSFQRAYEEKVEQLLDTEPLPKEECASSIGGIVGNGEGVTIENSSSSGEISLPLECKQYEVGGIIGSAKESQLKNVDSDMEITYNDPDQNNETFLQMHLIPIAHSVIATFIAFVISVIWRSLRHRKLQK